MDELINTLSMSVSEAGLSLIIATATLMSLVHLRNSHLSERARENISESLYKFKKSCLEDDFENEHRRSLTLQTQEFFSRYKRMSIAFALLAATLVIFMLAVVFCGTKLLFLQQAGLILSFFGFSFISIALYISAVEFLTGYRTLEKHISVINKSPAYHGNQSNI